MRQNLQVIRPQPGPQTALLRIPADVIIYGGSAGGGKSYGLLMAPLRYKDVPGFGCTIFRKNFNQIFAQGGLWDQSMGIYGGISGAHPRRSSGEWEFLDGAGNVVSAVRFAHLERDEDVLKWQGSQLCCIGFDELTHFSEQTFFYMLSRNRSACGVRPHVIATCNPDSESWVAGFIRWWIDQDTGYPIPERGGKLRFFLRREDQLHWADSRETLWEQFDLRTPEEKQEPRSVTFIPSSVYDNRALLEADPQYLSNLKALPQVERERLLMGNWIIRPAAGLYFKREQLGAYLPLIPGDVVQWVRCWDLAATGDRPDAACTAGVLIGKRENGRYLVADVINVRQSAAQVRKTVLLTAQRDRAMLGPVRIRLPQDPGQAGKEQAESYVRMLAGFDVTTAPESGSKEVRAEPAAAQWQAGNFDLVAADWNEPFLRQLESFPDGRWKDMVDALANGFAEIERRGRFRLGSLI